MRSLRCLKLPILFIDYRYSSAIEFLISSKAVKEHVMLKCRFKKFTLYFFLNMEDPISNSVKFIKNEIFFAMLAIEKSIIEPNSTVCRYSR